MDKENNFPPMREQFSRFEPIALGSRWFRAFRLPQDIIVIAEPYHMQEVFSFLILGSERALLLDTGMGVENIRNAVEALTDLPVMVVNSHTHFDHVGGNRLFEFVSMLDVPEAMERSARGYTLPAEDEDLQPASFFIPAPAWEAFFGGCPVRPLQPGQQIDLGGRVLTVDAVPGHSPDSLVLIDRDNKLLFCGDTVYPGPLYAHLNGSVPSVYRDTLRRLADTYSDYTLICSHNEPIRPGSLLGAMADAFDAVCADPDDMPHSTEGGLCRYNFDGFAIIMREST